ncbi:hypothetical protein PV703_15600 [Streptomyces sp. ME01-24h]|nr:hypothetical protein [Streptomyces sp. ME01-24h]
MTSQQAAALLDCHQDAIAAADRRFRATYGPESGWTRQIGDAYEELMDALVRREYPVTEVA